MKIKFGSIVTDGRGKLGGHVYSKNRGGNYIRTNIIPTNPQTQEQMQARGLFGSISANWRNLSDQEREQWRSFAEANPYHDIFGDSKMLTGNSAYVRSNMNLSVAQLAQIETPFDAKEDATAIINRLLIYWDDQITPESLKFQISFLGLDTDGMGDSKVVIHATAPFPASQRFAKNRYRVLTSLYDNELTNNVDIGETYFEKYGRPAEGMRIAIKLVHVKSNGLSTLLSSADGLMEG